MPALPNNSVPSSEGRKSPHVSEANFSEAVPASHLRTRAPEGLPSNAQEANVVPSAEARTWNGGFPKFHKSGMCPPPTPIRFKVFRSMNSGLSSVTNMIGPSESCPSTILSRRCGITSGSGTSILLSAFQDSIARIFPNPEGRQLQISFPPRSARLNHPV